MHAPDDAPARADCCTPGADPRIARHFDTKVRQRTARGALPPMAPISRRLLEDLSADLAAGTSPTVLELGCGPGALIIGLLERGASSGHGVDLSTESIEVARRRAAATGLADRVGFDVGDAASVPLAAHDWVVLDRVLCCYADLDRLLANALGAARRRIAFSVPVSSGWRGVINRLIIAFERLTEAVRKQPCPGYVHDVGGLQRRLADAGFHRTGSRTSGLWYIGVFDRQPEPW